MASQVIAFSRDKAGVGGKKSKEDVARDFSGAHKVVFGDVTVRQRAVSCGALHGLAALTRAAQSMDSLRATAFADKVDVVVSCLASRTGGVQVRRCTPLDVLMCWLTLLRGAGLVGH